MAFYQLKCRSCFNKTKVIRDGRSIGDRLSSNHSTSKSPIYIKGD